MIKKARLIYNPTSGREEGKKRLVDILRILDRAGIEATPHATEGKGDAEISAAKAVDNHYDMIIVAGGDGTLNEVINGISGKPKRPPLGVIPLGTTNDFARALGIPRYWEKACSIITRQVTRVVDVGQANEQYFINIAGGGYVTELTYEVPSRLKTIIGQLAYYMKGIEKMVRLRPTELRIELDGQEVYHEEFMLFLITNTNSVGGFEKLAPTASIDDGLFDVIMLKKCNLAEFIRIIGITIRGEHVNDPLIVHKKTKRVTVTSPHTVQLNLDGEFGGFLPATFRILPAHLKVFIN